MNGKKKLYNFRGILLFIAILFFMFSITDIIKVKDKINLDNKVYAGQFSTQKMPFYDLMPQDLVLRAEFYTSYPASSNERKSNIILATKTLNNTFVDVGAEFSFNLTVGERSEKRGYKVANIIQNGKFVQGVGGGVCQVSSTLYNAVLLSGLKILEYHPHSLAVSYVAPSFDAMVSSVSDLKFLNNTKNPIIIKATANQSVVKISIYGQPMVEKYLRESVVKEIIFPNKEEIVLDYDKKYPQLKDGEQLLIQPAKNGLKSQAKLIKTINGKVVSSKIIRNDKYNPISAIIVQGVFTSDEIKENIKN